MKRLSLTLILLATSTCSLAEWTRLKVDNAEYVFYVDFSTIQFTDISTVLMWDLFDYKASQEVAGSMYLSSKTLREYDCKNKRLREKASKWYSENMGKGEMVASSINNGTPYPWIAIPSDTTASDMLEIVCGSKALFEV